MLYIPAAQTVEPKPAARASPGNLLELRIITGLTLHPPNQKGSSSLNPQVIYGPIKVRKHDSSSAWRGIHTQGLWNFPGPFLLLPTKNWYLERALNILWITALWVSSFSPSSHLPILPVEHLYKCLLWVIFWLGFFYLILSPCWDMAPEAQLNGGPQDQFPILDVEGWYAVGYSSFSHWSVSLSYLQEGFGSWILVETEK